MARAHVFQRASAGAKQSLARLLRFRRTLDQIHDLPFGNAADLVQMEAALAFRFFGILRGTEERIGDHGQCGDRRSTHGQH